MRNGRGVDREMKVGQDVKNEGSTNQKNLHAVQKGECGGKSGKDFPKNRRQSAQNEVKREKSGLRRVKNERDPSKNRPKLGSEWGKARKTEILERKRRGGGKVKKWALLPILQCYEVAKWVQMNFSRIFFRRSLAGNGEMPYLCTRNREATLLQERVTL